MKSRRHYGYVREQFAGCSLRVVCRESNSAGNGARPPALAELIEGNRVRDEVAEFCRANRVG